MINLRLAIITIQLFSNNFTGDFIVFVQGIFHLGDPYPEAVGVVL